ncbi:MAG TPA: non-canonical purine NTP pyrophosphatase [Candidatus Omnitrophica bacterium]|nr:MAG: non-canonical purine NTP pyrophosphatase, RdgB/HAM1 family [Omnitrophica WOR_2 bacterium GWA2_45_18]OGX21285.1 MAG: non-canonical purine NTP pyrophosphatase, RdgB/HAM1 family [Omnitrophica WOR_2 bacterium GWC2_45_7]HBR14235.1 non-canonical purine NTP pyrophosphatase [Candidatus Omnitrophota bacterium]
MNRSTKRVRTELVVATKNKGKLREIKDLLKGFNIVITSLADYPDAPQIEEDGKTFRQNAVKKAVIVARYTKKLTLGEDSGIEVKALGNQPGIYSARFSGETATDKKNNLKLLRCLRGVPMEKRQARYRCFAALADKNGVVVDVVSGSCSGLITLRSRGHNGFGYDPLFFIPRFHKTFGELDPSIKAGISHRARALKKVKIFLQKYLR